MTDTYTFDAKPNSYFNGQDLGITRTSDARTVIVNRKGNAWAVNVKAEYTMQQRSLAVRTAASNLPDAVLSGLEEQCKDFFWSEAKDATKAQWLGDDIYQEGRSGGWAQIGATESFESTAPNAVLSKEQHAVDQFIALAFVLDDLRLEAEADFDAKILEANQELQIELSEYADWVGGSIRSLDGPVANVVKLEVMFGRVVLRTDASWFAFGTEAELLLRPDGTPAIELFSVHMEVIDGEEEPKHTGIASITLGAALDFIKANIKGADKTLVNDEFVEPAWDITVQRINAP